MRCQTRQAGDRSARWTACGPGSILAAWRTSTIDCCAKRRSDTFDEAGGRFTYRFRDAGTQSARALAAAEADNAKLIEAHSRSVPLVYFRGIGLALCAIHHLAYDRNLVGIDPDGVVHIHARLLDEIDGPMLTNGLQHFHRTPILQPSADGVQRALGRAPRDFRDYAARTAASGAWSPVGAGRT